MLSEVDPGVHTFMEQNMATPAKLNWNAYPGGYEAHYFMINGRSMPDTMAPNNAPWLPSQPYGAHGSRAAVGRQRPTRSTSCCGTSASARPATTSTRTPTTST